VLRSQTLHWYARALRVCRTVENIDVRRQLHRYVREQVEAHRHETDLDRFRHLLAEAHARLKRLQTTLQLSQ
jgi:predicted translin family RNA/ssDNA-binding protein